MNTRQRRYLIVAGGAGCVLFLIVVGFLSFLVITNTPQIPPKEPVYSEEERSEYEFITGPSPRVEVDAIWGEIRIEANTSGRIMGTVVKHVTDCDKSSLAERVNNIRQFVEHVPGTEADLVRFRTSYADEKQGGSADIRLRVSNGSALDIQGGSSLELSGFVTGVRLRQRNRSVVVDEVQGGIDLYAGHSGIHVRGRARQIRATELYSRIEIESNDVLVDARTEWKGDIHFTGTLGEGENVFRAERGSVVLVLPPDSGLLLDAQTVDGNIVCDFPLAQTSEGDARRRIGVIGMRPSVRVRIRTVSGDIIIRQGK